MKTVYGPVGSWRLGRSLGIDLLCTAQKTCPFNCVYCQMGSKGRHPTTRRVYIETGQVLEELRAVLPKVQKRTDVLTFSGTGEPTLAANLGEVVDGIRDITKLPTAILTNSSLLTHEGVRRVLTNIDIVVAKLDAADKETFEKVNRPAAGIDFMNMVEGLQTFAEGYRGQFAIQVMFVEGNKDKAQDIADMVSGLEPELLFIGTPLRPCEVAPLSEKEVAKIRKIFEGRGDYKISDPYTSKNPEVEPLDAEEVKKRGRLTK